jgi:carbon storage regulator
MAMLVLTRRAGETFLIGDDIEISIIEAQGDRVKIGITAPRDVRVLRKELVDEARSANAQAAEIDISLETLAEAISGK